MTSLVSQPPRREFLRAAGAAVVGATSVDAVRLFAAPKPRPKVAAIFTEFRLRSHAYVILENFFEPYFFNGELVDPGCDVAAMYADQFPEGDMAREVSKRFRVPLYESIDKALCCGGDKLAVDAVLLIGEHGDYPYDKIGRHMYPRKQFFDQAIAVMDRSGRHVPLFNDKHLCYRWDWAKEMYDAARKRNMPLMAGSSVPLAERVPPLELPRGAEIETAVVVHGGEMETYGFHGLELLQSLVENRSGGETGIASVQVLLGDEAERAADRGLWSRELLQAALAVEKKYSAPRQVRPSPGPAPSKAPAFVNADHVIVVNYNDGLQGAVVAKKGETGSSRWGFACKLKNEDAPHTTLFYNGPWGNRGLFKALSHAIQYLFVERREPYQVERTLLTGGAIDAAMQSHDQKKAIETPHLDVRYDAVDFRQFREMGRTWRRITVDTLQPTTFAPGDARLKISQE